MVESLRSSIVAICNQHLSNSPPAQAMDITGGGTSTATATTTATSIINRNPYTVLSLDPNQLSSMFNISIESVYALRKDVADAIASNDIVGHSSMNMNVMPTGIHNEPQGEESSEGVSQLQANASFLTGGNTALQVYLNKSKNTNAAHPISTGSEALDQLISKSSRKRPRQQDTENKTDDSTTNNRPNGIQFAKITQASGPSPSGKTQLALSLSANAIASGHKVHYIASGGGSAGLVPIARRLRHILGIMYKNGRMGVHMSANERDDLLNEVQFDYALDGYRLLAILNQLEHEIRHDVDMSNDNGEKRSVLLVIDSISGCLASLLYGEGDGGVGAALLNEIHIVLRRISRLSSSCNSNIAVFVTNGMVSDNKRGRKPALGEMWRVADVHVVLEPMRDVVEEVRGADDLERVTMKCVRARLENDNSEKCTGDNGVNFGVAAAGIVDTNE